jgi:hypothetical protein
MLQNLPKISVLNVSSEGLEETAWYSSKCNRKVPIGWSMENLIASRVEISIE